MALIGFGAWYGLRQVYFLGIDEGGRVSLYRGLPYDLPLGISLYSEQSSLPVQAASVPADRRDSVTDHTLRSHDDAVDLLDDLQRAATEPTQTTTQPQGGANGGSQGGGGGGLGRWWWRRLGGQKPASGGQQGQRSGGKGSGRNGG